MEKVTIVKVGGAIVEDNEQLAQLLTDFAAIPGKKVLVHGGGRRATKVAAALGIESKMVNGRRITDAQMLEVPLKLRIFLYPTQNICSLPRKPNRAAAGTTPIL